MVNKFGLLIVRAKFLTTLWWAPSKTTTFFFTPALSPEILSPTLDKLSQLTLNNIDGYVNIP